MTYFPQINSAGLITQLPYQTSQSFKTVYQRPPASRPYGMALRGGGFSGFPTGPLSRFAISYSTLADTELATLKTFFESQYGRFGQFTLLDPGGNLIQNSEDFSNLTWTSQSTSVTIAATGVADPWGGTRASTLTATSSNSLMSPIVIPSGSLPTGYILCGSLYARALSAGQSLSLGFVDSGFTVLGSSTQALPQNIWTRIQFAMAFSTSSYIRMLIGGFGTWNSTSISFFGPQCVPMPGAGGYQKTPDNYGLHTNCRFDTDVWMPTFVGPNESRIDLPILEFNV